MFSAAARVLPIKDLKDLSVLFSRRGAIDMQVLKDLKRCPSRMRSRGTDPRATRENVPFTVGRGPVPRRATCLKQDLHDYHDLPRLERLMHRIPRGLP